MRICSRCGNEFDLFNAKRILGREYGAGVYDRYYDNGDICESCARMEISADAGAGEEDIENMGFGWDWD